VEGRDHNTICDTGAMEGHKRLVRIACLRG